MSDHEAGLEGDLQAVVEELQGADRFLLTTHEGPDGDALGSMLGMHAILTQLGKDSVMFLGAKEFPLPVEYRFLQLEEVFHEPPADVAERLIVFLDCGNIDRMPVDWLQQEGSRIVNIDHHHDNTRFGAVNLVDSKACCTAQIVYEVAQRLGAEITAEIANALYVGLVTDTGRFSYENVDARAHRLAAELIEAGVDVGDTYRRLYERVPLEKLRLISRAIAKIERREDGRLSVVYLADEDYQATGSSEALSEGIIDYVRSLNGTSLAAVIRDKTDDSRAARKVSLRSANGGVDVSAIAREHGGGGHKRAAGFSTDLSYPELVEFLSAKVREPA